MLLVRLIWLVPLTVILLIALLFVANEYAVANGSKRIKDISYTNSDSASERHRLDVYVPRSLSSKSTPVVVFIHGGSWDSGSKNIYAFVGRRLANLGVVAVLVNYRLAPAVEVPDMVVDCAQALRWTTQHIAEYGGDPNQIFVMGHSAGAGLAALLAVDSHYFTQLGLSQNPIKGAILDDPAGLDMFDYLTRMEYPGDERYLIPFGEKPAIWRMVSALYHVDANCPPILLYTGEETYPSIIKSSRKFNQQLERLGIRHTLTVIAGKKHVGMALQLFWRHNIIYQDLSKFVGVK
jgi:acetyl esterase/lipase